MNKKVIYTDEAPKAIGTYSQAIRVENFVFLSGQIPLDPITMELQNQSIQHQIHQTFKNLLAVIKAAEARPEHLVKLTIYLTDLNDFALVNEIMPEYITEPFPARAVIGVHQLPKGANIEIEGILYIL